MSDLVNVDDRELSERVSSNINNQAGVIEDKFTQASNLFLNGDPTEWAGKDADAYKQKLEELKAKIVTSIEDMNSLSKEIIKQSNQITEQDTSNSNEIQSYA